MTRTAAVLLLVSLFLPLALLAGNIAICVVTDWTQDGRWTVVAGTPEYSSSLLRNSASDPSTPLQYQYTGAVQLADQSITSSLAWSYGSYPIFSHYLRFSSGGHYRIEAAVYPSGGGASYLRLIIYRYNGQYEAGLNTSYTTALTSPATLTSTVSGNSVTVSVNSESPGAATDSVVSSGGMAVGTQNCAYDGCGIGQTTLYICDSTPPSTPPNFVAAPYATRVNLSWGASTDNLSLAGYNVYRDDVQIGSVNKWTLSYSDIGTFTAGSHTYAVEAYDTALNTARATTTVEIPHPSDWAPDTGGPVGNAATWGAGPETIGLLNGVLSAHIPLPRFTHRSSGPGFQMAAVWNSGFWSKDTTGTRMSALDIGYGLSFNFIIGAVYPAYAGGQIDHVEYLSADGIAHRLDPTDLQTRRYFEPHDSTYLTWDDQATPYPTLTFKDGSVWTFGAVSRDTTDGGTRYPTELRDTNGNLITVTYGAARGFSDVLSPNTSGRIVKVTDSQTTYNWVWSSNETNGLRHLSGIYHSDGSQNYTDAAFYYDSPQPRTITSPLPADTPPFSAVSAVLLTRINFTGLMKPYEFEYDSAGLITKITTPHKGYFRYEYGSPAFSNDTRYTREISKRWTSANTTTEQEFVFSHPDDQTASVMHVSTKLVDPTGTQKKWFLIQGGWSSGLCDMHKIWPAGVPSDDQHTPLRAIATTWAQDASPVGLGNPRVSSTTSTLEDGATRSLVEQDVDTHGNVTVVREYGYGDDSTPARSTSTTYLHTNKLDTDPYVVRKILNRPTQIRVCMGAAGCATPVSLTSITYDSTGIQDIAGITQHDSTYGATFSYRGNPTVIDANGLITNANYDIGGNARSTTGAANQTISYVQANTTQVSQVQGGGSTTSYSYYNDLTLAGVTGSNSDTTAFSYVQRRPMATSLPGGSQVVYNYADYSNGNFGAAFNYPFWRTETTTGGRVSKTFYDGFGRVIKTAVRDAAGPPEVWIYSETQYGACSCSPMGRMVKTSRPYRGDASGNPSETIYWTETQYDALGRTTAVILPDTNQSTYVYSVVNGANWKGTVTTITDPAAKQKSYLYDAFGRLLRVQEQRDSATLVETARYTYDTMGRLTEVAMPNVAGTYTQLRTFVYNTPGQLTSATNPENGAVTYTYNSDGLLESKTDAKSQTLWYVYDTYHRVTAIQSPQGTNKATFGYDSGANGIGRLTSIGTSEGYNSNFTYNVMGRVTTQLNQYPSDNPYYPWLAQAQYAYDGDGRMTDLYYPGQLQAWPPTPTAGKHVKYSYDTLGRPLTMQGYNESLGCWEVMAQDALYGSAGQLTGWKETASFSYTWEWNEETQQWVQVPYGYTFNTMARTYDGQRGWLTGVNAKNPYNQNLVDLHYRYLADGRVSGVYDSVNPGLSALYQYDSMNRLSATTAGQLTDPNATQWAISPSNPDQRAYTMAWAYDEFGNRTSQSGAGYNGYAAPPAVTLAYNEATNRITTGGYSYDLNGNVTAMPGVSGMEWDVFDRMTQNTVNGTTSDYKYDALGRRMARVRPGAYEVDRYFYDMSGRLLSAYAWGNPSWPVHTTYFAGQKLTQWSDRVGSVRRVGGVVNQYYPYGELLAGPTNTGFKYAETYRDDTGLDYAMNRYYASGIGRFLSVDSGRTHPTQPQSFNRYSYAFNDPVNFKDPVGLDGMFVTGSLSCRFDWEMYRCDYTDSGMGPGGTKLGNMGPDAPYVEPGGGGGGEFDHLATLTSFEDALTAALHALRTDEDCRSIYGLTPGASMDPATLLNDMAHGTQSGRIKSGSTAEGDAADSEYLGVLSQTDNPYYYVNSQGVRIQTTIASFTVNPDYWGKVNNDVRARILLHELGHISSMLTGGGGSLYKNEIDPKTNQINKDAVDFNSALEKRCIK